MFLFEAMKETHEQHKTKIDIDELITGPTNTNITLFLDVQKQPNGLGRAPTS